MSQINSGLANVTNGSATVTSDSNADWTTVRSGNLFIIPGTFTTYQIAATPTYSGGVWHLTLSSNYGGATASLTSYVISTSFTPNLGIPYSEHGDTQTAAINKRAMQMLDTLIATGSLVANSRRSFSVTADATIGNSYGIEQVSASQTGDAAAFRVFTSAVGSSYLGFGRYTSVSAFDEWARFTPGGILTLNRSTLVMNGVTLTAPATSGTIALTSQIGSASTLTTGTLALALLPTSGVSSGSYGSATQIPTFTVDVYGRLTAASFVSVSASGEVNTGTNLGATTYGLYAGKSGTTLQFKSLLQGANVTLTATGNDITISASASASLIPNTRQSFGITNTQSTGDMFGVEQVSAGQTGDFNALRLFTSALSTAYIGFGRYTNATAYDDFGRFSSAGILTLNRSTFVINGQTLTAPASSGTIALTSQLTTDASLLTSGTLPAARLPTSGATASTYGSSTLIPIVTVDATGRVTSISTVTASTGSGGEVNTASNVGGGYTIYQTKTGVNFTFKTLTAGADMQLNDSTNSIEIASTLGSSVSSLNTAVTTLNGQVSSLITTVGSIAASSGAVTFVQASAPTGAVAGDLWFDTSNSNRINRYDGTSWNSVRDSAIISILATYATTTYVSTQTAAAQTAAIAAANTNTATQILTRSKTFYQSTTPTATATNDLWINTADQNKLYVWNSTAWTLSRDTQITTLASSITTLSSTKADVAALTTQTSRIDTLNSQINTPTTGLAATVSTISSTYASTTYADAKKSEAISAAAGDATAKVNTELLARTAADGFLSGQYALKVTAGNVVTGMNITSSTSASGGTTSSIVFQAGVVKFQSGASSLDALLSGGAAADVNANTTTISGGKIAANSVTASKIQVVPSDLVRDPYFQDTTLYTAIIKGTTDTNTTVGTTNCAWAFVNAETTLHVVNALVFASTRTGPDYTKQHQVLSNWDSTIAGAQLYTLAVNRYKTYEIGVYYSNNSNQVFTVKCDYYTSALTIVSSANTLLTLPTGASLAHLTAQFTPPVNASFARWYIQNAGGSTYSGRTVIADFNVRECGSATLLVDGSITTSKLNFTPVTSTNVVASINASAEGLRIASNMIHIDGSVTFSSGFDPSTKADSSATTTALASKIASGGAASDVNSNTTLISGGKIVTGTITAAHLNVSNLSLITTDMGTMTQGTIAIGSGTQQAQVMAGMVQLGRISIVSTGTVNDTTMTVLGGDTSHIDLVAQYSGVSPALIRGFDAGHSVSFLISSTGNATFNGLGLLQSGVSKFMGWLSWSGTITVSSGWFALTITGYGVSTVPRCVLLQCSNATAYQPSYDFDKTTLSGSNTTYYFSANGTPSGTYRFSVFIGE